VRNLAFFALMGLVLVAACADDDPRPVGPGPEPEDTTITEYNYRVVNTFPHDTGAFTEGLIWDDSVLVEGTGYFNGASTLRRVRLETGEIIQQRDTPLYDFGEGIVRVGDRIVQLTWTEQVAYIYDASTFDSLGTFTYPTEGWGLTTDGARFIMSDGTATLYFRHLDTFAETGRITVRDENGPVLKLNELEHIDGRVWANVFESPLIVMIDPRTGRVRGRVDMTGLIYNPPDVLNGIARDPATDRIFVTGKRWPSLFEITLTPENP
jgi:glutaminyl-peptide cyclotransferase